MVLGAGLWRWSARPACSASRLVARQPGWRSLPALAGVPRRLLADASYPNPRVYLDIAIGSAEPQRITFEVCAAPCCCLRERRCEPHRPPPATPTYNPGCLLTGAPLVRLLRSFSRRRCPRQQVRAAFSTSASQCSQRTGGWADPSRRTARREFSGTLHRREGHARRDWCSLTFQRLFFSPNHSGVYGTGWRHHAGHWRRWGNAFP